MPAVLRVAWRQFLASSPLLYRHGSASRPNELLIAIRGTDTLADVVTDLCQSVPRAIELSCPSGFATTFDSFQPMLHQFLSLRVTLPRRMVASLGGAMQRSSLTTYPG
jgi:hypothetical protein